MADMATARNGSLEGIKLLTVSYQVRGEDLRWILIFNSRMAMILVPRRSPGSLGFVRFAAERWSRRFAEFSEHNL